MKTIPLTRGFEAIVDDDDYECLSKFNWCASSVTGKKNKFPYAMRGFSLDEWKTQEAYLMHRVIISAPKGVGVDHINKNTLDNRKANLRLANQTQNMRNRGKTVLNKTGFKGVHIQNGRFKATINAGSGNIHLGYFDTAEKAHAAYSAAALKHHGEFARVA